MQHTKPILNIATLSLAAALCAQVAQAAPAAPQGFIGHAMQAAADRMKNDDAAVVNPRVIDCSPPGFIARALYPDAQEVCQVTATLVLVPRSR